MNVAFAALAATTPTLQAVQAELLAAIRAELTAVLGPGREVHAAMLLATVDGLALHEISAPGTLGADTMKAALELAIAAARRSDEAAPYREVAPDDRGGPNGVL